MNKVLRRSGMAFVVTGMVLCNMHAVKAVETEVKPSKVDNVYVYDQSALMNEYTEAVTSKPTYIIYPDQQVCNCSLYCEPWKRWLYTRRRG